MATPARMSARPVAILSSSVMSGTGAASSADAPPESRTTSHRGARRDSRASSSARRPAATLAAFGNGWLASNDSNREGAIGTRVRAASERARDHAAANGVALEVRKRARHRPGSLACGHDEEIARTHGDASGATAPSGDTRSGARCDGSTASTAARENPARVIAQLGKRGGQCNCVGSDQPERPVTALNLRSNPAITCSASSCAQSCSSWLMTRASASSASVIARSEKYSRCAARHWRCLVNSAR